MQPIIAELTVEDVDVSVHWYRLLGFEVDLEGLRDEDGLQWASLALDERAVWLLRADMSPFSTEHPPRVSLYLQVSTIDDLYAHLIDQDVQTESRPANKWYGLREFALTDPDGFRWVINQPIPPEETPAPPSAPLR